METAHAVDYLIIGAGPAGLQLGYYLEKNKSSYIILEAGEAPGAFFDLYPRHRQLISINKIHTGYDDPEINLRWDWNSLLSDDEELLFRGYSKRYFPEATDLKRYLADFAGRFGLKIQYGTTVARVSRDRVFEVVDQRGAAYRAERLIVATGLSKLYAPQIKGIELGETYAEFSTKPEDYRNQRVLIIGKGNSAFESANNLIETAASIHLCSPTPVTLAWKTHYVGNLRAINNQFLDTYQLKSQNAILDANIEAIERDGDKFIVKIIYTHAKGERREISFDRVLVCAGFRFDASIFDESCRPELTIRDKYPAMTHEWESTNVEGLYFAGGLMHARDYRNTMSGFIHGFRYNIRSLSLILARKYGGAEWPSEPVRAVPETLADIAIKRVNRSSAMFLQPGYFCDVLTVSSPGALGRHYGDMPVDYVRSSDFGENDWYYTITLEYGDFHSLPDPFFIDRDPDPAAAHLTAYLHPIVRRYKGSALVRAFHVPEDLENVYATAHHAQLLGFFQEELAAPVAQGDTLDSMAV